MQFTSLDEVLNAHKANELEFKKLEQTIERQGNKIGSLQKEIQELAKPLIKRAKKFEIKMQNNTITMQKIIIRKHQLEGAILQMGGIIPKDTEIVLPELLPEEEELLQ